MLKLTTYTKPELSEIFGTQSTESLNRKMTRYGIEYDKSGRGQTATYTIKNIKDPFKVFCILDLGFDGGTDFRKLRDFYYHYFNDDIFMAMPDEVKENQMRERGQPVSRQTIANYTYRLENNGLIDRNTHNYIYYFAFKTQQRIVEKQEYLQAWHEYWDDITEGFCSYEAICRMRAKYGGVARKQAIPEINGIYNKEIEYMRNLIQENIENEMAD